MGLRAWLRPPGSLLVILLLLTLVSVSALGWLGWRLISQDRIVAAERARERLEEAADRMASRFRRYLENDSQLQGLFLTVAGDTLTVAPPGHLLYYPQAAEEPEAPAIDFRDGEGYEFREEQLQQAADSYQKLAATNDAAVRAGALLRLARVMRKSGHAQESLAVYRKLDGIPGVRVAGAPAELVARHEICVLQHRAADAKRLLAGLRDSKWQLRRGQFEFYWADAARLAGDREPPDATGVALAEAAQEVVTLSTTAHEAVATLWVRGIPLLIEWRGSASRPNVLLATADSVMRQIAGAEKIDYAALDRDGRLLAGVQHKTGRPISRGATEFHIPWTLAVWPRPLTPAEEVFSRQGSLRIALAVMMLFLLSGTYFIARAIRREADIARLQSDFVSAVSHEFRSPLTSMRQLSEILAEGRAPSEERRQVYYETLVTETKRLERLVETLLNFGRMEARARRYKLEEIDAGQFAENVVAAFEREIPSARKVELARNGACPIRADAEALAVALRNLLDNAVKYSPRERAVQVDVGRDGQQVAVRVHDHGPGIPPGERKSIFRKFVRGSAAAALNVKGTGLGLAMARQIVAAHDGEIRLESAPGEGSTFIILLPAVERT